MDFRPRSSSFARVERRHQGLVWWTGVAHPLRDCGGRPVMGVPMPHTPSGSGIMLAADAPLALVRMSMKASRSIDKIIAWHNSGSSKGGAAGLISIVRGTLTCEISQIACGACVLKSFKVGSETPNGVVMP